MNLGSISDQLPTYPNNIQGELRIILQTKDVFLVCYKHLEEYRRLVNEQNRLITKEFVQEQLQIGEDEISELKMELQDAESRLGARLRHNELLADHLASLGFASLESGGSVRHLALCRSPQMRKNMLAQRGGAAGMKLADSRPPTHMIDNIALAIAEIHQEVRNKVKPLLDYYRDLFYLQLHFSLVLGQVCNYCMPLVTENIGLIDRIFFWSERPEFDLVRRAGDIGDRLKEIYTRAQTVLGVLAESVRFLQSKVELQKTLEQRFHERLDEQQKMKDKILREVHTTKQNMDMLEEENDRLVGSLVKVDPSFVDSRHFYELAEGGSLMGAKKPGSSKETAQNNAEDRQETTNNISPAGAGANDDMEQDEQGAVRFGNRRVPVTGGTENASAEVNNNKALSIADPPTDGPVAQEGSRKPQSEELEALLKDIKAKMNLTSKKNVENKNTSNINNKNDSSDLNTSVMDASDLSATQTLASGVPAPAPKKSSHTAPRNRSKSRRRDLPHERAKSTTPKEGKTKVRRRATSAEREQKETKTRKHRPKSTMGERRRKDIESHSTQREEYSFTPDKGSDDVLTSSISSGAGDSVTPPAQPQISLKTKLLGRTRDLLEAALRRSPKSSSTDLASKTGEIDSTLVTGRMDTEEINNDGVTSVSSFASLMVGDSPLGDPEYIAPANRSSGKQLRTLEPRKNTQRSKKSRSGRRGKSQVLEYDQQPLPSLSSEKLLIETNEEEKSNPATPTPKHISKVSSKTKHSKSRRATSQAVNNLGDFLAGSPLESSQTPPSGSSALPSLL
ncbi:unnamed protein product [Calicophoron daubneyi]|uniref:DUF5743 domain-containing protein n=1 Tax=Calicophoron daubneyi TaxID=300641 RepID=A0AAV2TQT0_CALDB